MHEIRVQVLETNFVLSAEQMAGARTPSGDILWHGSQPGRVMLADRQLKVQRPRLRHRQEGEIKIPAYEALQTNDGTAERMVCALLRGVGPVRNLDDIRSIIL